VVFVFTWVAIGRATIACAPWPARPH
jgi:hypothetical protein